LVITVSGIMYKRLGISNTDIALYTSWLYLPWVIKPLWSPIVDLMGTKRLWVVVMQGAIGAVLAMAASAIPAPRFFQYTIALLWLVAFSSATHDVAADGLYMLGDSTRGCRTCLADLPRSLAKEDSCPGRKLENGFASLQTAWEITIFAVAACWPPFLSLGDLAATDRRRRTASQRPKSGAGVFRVFVEFFKKDRLRSWCVLALFRAARLNSSNSSPFPGCSVGWPGLGHESGRIHQNDRRCGPTLRRNFRRPGI
jgi:PAT family beta-lactamase induction signal transducer AmpG